jgi:hypothetical protein
MADSVQIELEVVTKKALASVDQFTKTAQSSLDSINFKTGVSAITDGLRLLNGISGAAFSFFSRANQEALEAETSISQLNNAMRITGDFSAFASQRAQEYAQRLSEVTVFSDNQIVSALALAKNYGLVNSESRKVVAAATNLAAITGTDLNTAVEKLARTYSGSAKELKKQFRELEGLTEAELRAGAAVDILSAKLAGSATAALNSTAGSLASARKEVDKFYESVGNGSLRVTAFLIRDSIALKNRVLDLVSAIKRDSTVGETIFDQVGKSIKRAQAATEENFNEKAAEKAADTARKAFEFKEKAEEAFQKVRLELEGAGLSEIEKINLEAERKIKIVKDAARAGNVAAIQDQEALIAGIRIKQAKDTAAEMTRIENERLAKEAKERSRAEGFAGNPGTGIAAVVTGQKLTDKEAGAIGAGLINAVAKGAAGAKDLVTSTIGAIAEFYLPVVGSAIKGILDFLSKSPEEVRETVQAFIKEIPKTFKAILISLPELMIGFFEALPDFISAFIEAVPKIIEALIRALPRLFAAILKLWVKGIPIIVKEFIFQIPNIVKGFVVALIDAAKQFVNAIVDGIKEFFGGLGGDSKAGAAEGIPIVGDVVGFVGGAIGSVGDFFGLAEGGRVPDVQRFEGDRFPARLDAGEQVFSGDLSDKLEQFLSGQSSQPIQITLNVGQSELAKVMLNLNRNGFRTA